MLLVYSYKTSTAIDKVYTHTKVTPIQYEVHNTINVPIEPSIQQPQNPLPQQIKNSLLPDKSTEDSSKTITMYEAISLNEAKLTTKVRQNIIPVSAIQIDQESLKHLKIQDTIVLPDIEGIDYPLSLTHIQKNSDGSVTTSSSYTDEGIQYTTTMTQSDEESFISLSTAQGLYEIETNHGIGYIYKTQDIRKHMQKSSHTDVIILPIPKRNLIKK